MVGSAVFCAVFFFLLLLLMGYRGKGDVSSELSTKCVNRQLRGAGRRGRLEERTVGRERTMNSEGGRSSMGVVEASGTGSVNGPLEVSGKSTGEV